MVCLCTCLYHRFETIDAARNKIRVKACYVMMATTIGACLLMVLLGKQVSDDGRLLCDCVHCIGLNLWKIVQWLTCSGKE